MTQACRRHEVWLITRSNNRDHIEAAIAAEPLQGLHVEYYDTPEILRFWKKGQRGVYLYYAMWQWGAYRRARRLQDDVRFDIVHHVTFANYWLPTFMPRLGIPFIFGPVGGGEAMPDVFLAEMSEDGRRFELRRKRVLSLAGRTSTIRRQLRSGRTLATSDSMADRARDLGAENVTVFGPPVGVSDEERHRLLYPTVDRDAGQAVQFISIGRLLPWKGFHLGLRAFAEVAERVPDATYSVVGDGPEREHLESLVRSAGLVGRVRFLGTLPRHETLRALAECDVLIHPSLHDPGAWVVAEALSAGMPVVCHDCGGPAALVGDAGVVIGYTDPLSSISELAQAMERLAVDREYRRRLSELAQARSALLSWDHQGDRMDEVYRDVAG